MQKRTGEDEVAALGALMCMPVYYGIPAAENPHMNPNERIDRELASREWTDLFNLLQRFGLSVRLMPPVRHRWDMVFTANGGWAHGKEALVANFRQEIRQPEKEHFYEWFKRLGFNPSTGGLRGIPTEPEYIAWEGQGDTLMGSDGACFLGWGIRSDYAAKPYVEDMLFPGERVIDLQLVNRHFYHLDTCATALRSCNAFVYYPAAFSPTALDNIRKLPFDLIALSPILANCFVANSIYLKDVFLLNVPFAVSEDSRLLSARGVFLSEDDARFDEFVAFDGGQWKRNAHLVKKLRAQHIRGPFQIELSDTHRRAGYVWYVRELWKRGMKIVPVYTSQFEPSGAGARCCVMFLDWLLSNG